MIRQDARMSRVSRRAVLKALGTTAALLPALSPDGVLAFARIQAGNAAPLPKVLPASSFRTLEVLVEAHHPHRRAIARRERSARRRLHRPAPERKRARAGAAVDGRTGGTRSDRDRADSAAPSPASTPAQLDAILADISKNESDPATPLEEFFVMSKQATIRGYYTSEIGIHRELRYKGNQFLQEFVGCATEDGKDCPHCGQKAKA